MSDFLEVLGVVNEDLNAQLESEFMEVQIKTGDFGFFDVGGHQLVSLDCLDGISVDQLTFSAALSVGFEEVDIFDVVL